jgi:tripartite-type tricarboxylate transporter receptor subunit TctC
MRLSVTRRGMFAAGLAAAAAGTAQAQTFPNRPIRLVVPFAPGGGVDAVGRILAEPLGTLLGQPVVVENRAGAGGAIGVDAVAKSPPDGYTLSLVSPGNMTAGPVVRPTPYDPMALGFVSMVTRSPLLLVCRNGIAAQTLAEFVALVKRQPDAIRFASGGVGTGTHLAGELMNLRLGTRMVHVPYRGTGPALTDLIAGNVDIFFSDASAWPMVQQGQLRLLAVSSARPWQASPQTPVGRLGGGGIRHLQLVRHHCRGRHAGADPRKACRRTRQGAREARGDRGARPHRIRRRADAAHSVRRLREGGTRHLAHRRPGRQHPRR